MIPRASRIRRDPPPKEKPKFWLSREWERRLAVIGVVAMAAALSLIWVWLSHMTADDNRPVEIRLNAGSE